mmetsp:Transcript_1335/g.1953  ORF Transcript_1335/g.1953 Transcript_1335/m.1953 type:complete len:110 (-) Transcript_1335:859-1188(-)
MMTVVGFAECLLMLVVLIVPFLVMPVLLFGANATMHFTCIVLLSGLSHNKTPDSSVQCADPIGAIVDAHKRKTKRLVHLEFSSSLAPSTLSEPTVYAFVFTLDMNTPSN